MECLQYFLPITLHFHSCLRTLFYLVLRTRERQAPGTQVTSILHLAMRGELAEAKIFYVTVLRHKEELAYLGEHRRL